MEILQQAQLPLYTLSEQTVLGTSGQPETAKTACHRVQSTQESKKVISKMKMHYNKNINSPDSLHQEGFLFWQD